MRLRASAFEYANRIAWRLARFLHHRTVHRSPTVNGSCWADDFCNCHVILRNDALNPEQPYPIGSS